jgi:hypothetical protein
MERSLVWSALALGCVGWLCAMLVLRAAVGASSQKVARSFLMTAFALPLIVFLATLPDRPPFASGHGFGWGFLLGGAGACVVGLSLLKPYLTAGSALRAASLITLPCFVALVAVSAALLLRPSSLLDALMGVAIGWFAVSVVWHYGLSDAADSEAIYRVSFPGLAFVITLCATVALGEIRVAGLYASETGRVVMAPPWRAAALGLGAAIPFSLIVCALPISLLARLAVRVPFAGLFARLFGPLLAEQDTREVAVRGWRLILCGFLIVGLGELLALKVLDDPNLFITVCIGLAVGVLAWWLIRDGLIHAETETPGRLSPWPLAAAVVLGGFMAAFYKLAGYGVGVMLLGVWMIFALANMAALERGETAPGRAADDATLRSLFPLLGFGVLLLLYRFVSSRFEGELRSANLTDHFALFGILLGALLPSLLARSVAPRAVSAEEATSDAPEREQAQRSVSASRVTLARLILAGALALATPALALILWGAKVALAILIGLALAALGVRSSGVRKDINAPDGERAQPSVPMPDAQPLFALAVALALAQWTNHALPLAAMTRAEKIRLALWITGGLLALLLASDYGGRIGNWLRRRRAGGASPVVSGGE